MEVLMYKNMVGAINTSQISFKMPYPMTNVSLQFVIFFLKAIFSGIQNLFK